MFTDDVESQTIDGVKYFTFQPNTIVYAAAQDSELGQQIKSARIGVVWHTTYTGNELQSMKASFGADISKLKRVRTVWVDDASYRDVSGRATFTESETQAITNNCLVQGLHLEKSIQQCYKSFLIYKTV